MPRNRRRDYGSPLAYPLPAQMASPIAPEHIPGVRRKLRAEGYHVSLKGPMTARLLRAWKNYRSSVHYGYHRSFDPPGSKAKALPPALWNKRNPIKGDGGSSVAAVLGERSKGQKDVGVPDPKVKAHQSAKTKVKARVHAQGLGVKGHGGGGGGGSGVPGVGGDINLPTSTADEIAGLQYDPAIREAHLQQLRQQRDEEQAQHDIGHWGDIVEGSLGRARGRDTETNQRVSGDVQGAIQGIQNLLGGSRGAGVVGAAGVNDLAALGAAGAAQEQFDSDMAPILRGQQSDQSARERALASQEAEKLRSSLVDLQGQRGQAKAKALVDLRQQNFTNRLALQNAALAAESMGLKHDEVMAQLKQMGLGYQIDRAKLSAAQQAANPHADWGKLNTFDRQKVINNAIQQAIGQLPPKYWDEAHIRNAALAGIRAGGYHSARKMGYKGKIPNRQNQASILAFLNQGVAQAYQKAKQEGWQNT